MNPCHNPTCSQPARSANPGAYCSRRCQVACLNNLGYHSVRIRLDMDAVHLLEHTHRARLGGDDTTITDIITDIIDTELDRIAGTR